jgi:hypothetical protein
MPHLDVAVHTTALSTSGRLGCVPISDLVASVRSM